jgi:von Willebrand factor A domain-containing protein 8
VQDSVILFPESSSATGKLPPTAIPRFDASQDPEGVASHVPHMDHFYDNSLQTGLMRNLAIDLELLGNHLVLLGNQVYIG